VLAAAAHSGHVGGGPGLVDKDEPGRIKPALARAPPLPRGVRPGASVRWRGRFFLKLMPCRSKKRQSPKSMPGVVFAEPVAGLGQGEVRRLGHSCSSQSRCRSSAIERRSTSRLTISGWHGADCIAPDRLWGSVAIC